MCLGCESCSARTRSSSHRPATRSTQVSRSTRFVSRAGRGARVCAGTRALAWQRVGRRSGARRGGPTARRAPRVGDRGADRGRARSRRGAGARGGAGDARRRPSHAGAAAGQLVLALYRSGRQADALTAYRSGRGAFIELGLEPGPALRELELRILRHDPTLLSAKPAAQGSLARRPRRWVLVAAVAVAVAVAAAIASAMVASGMRRQSFRSAPTHCWNSTRQPTRSSAASRSGGTPPPSRQPATHSGSQANASAPCPASISAPVL